MKTETNEIYTHEKVEGYFTDLYVTTVKNDLPTFSYQIYDHNGRATSCIIIAHNVKDAGKIYRSLKNFQYGKIKRTYSGGVRG